MSGKITNGEAGLDEPGQLKAKAVADERAQLAMRALESKVDDLQKQEREKQKGIGTSPSDPKPPLATERMLRFFRYEHLPPALQAQSKPFCELAHWLCSQQAPSPERTKALNALIEAKDWAVRALVPE